MNKKAGFFALLTVLFIFILTGYTLYTFTLAKAKVDASVNSPLEIIEFNQEIEKQEIYDKEEVEMESVQVFYEILKQGAVRAREDCKLTGDYIIFNDNCEPDENEIIELFIEKIQDKEKMKDYSFSFSEENTKLVASKYNEKEMNLENPFATYNIKYGFDYRKDYTIDLNEEEISFSEIMSLYNEAFRCKDSENIVECLNVENWELDFNEEDYKFFDFNSENYYYYYDNGEVFSSIRFRFALE
jgi:hypothetical protein